MSILPPPTPYFTDESTTLFHGDSLEVLRQLPDASVDCCVTSPPYFGLRDYGVTPTEWPEITYVPMGGLDAITIAAETVALGAESSPIAFVAHLVAVFREVRRALAGDGTFWLNLGDSYYSGRGAATGVDEKNAARRFGVRALDKSGASWAKPKDLLGIPWRVAFALQADGWFLRNDDIWAKSSPMPEAVRDRCTSSHEHIFMFAKSRSYYFDGAAIAETATGRGSGNSFRRDERLGRGGPDGEHEWAARPQLVRALAIANEKGLTEAHFAAIRAVGMNDAGKAVATQSGAGKNAPEVQRLADEAKAALGGYYREFLTGGTKNRRDVWTIAPEPFPEAHFATYPSALPERCLLAGCRPGGVVLDIYSGSGTTGLAAARNGRKYVGIDLNADYLDLSLRTRLAQPGLMFGEATA